MLGWQAFPFRAWAQQELLALARWTPATVWRQGGGNWQHRPRDPSLFQLASAHDPHSSDIRASDLRLFASRLALCAFRQPLPAPCPSPRHDHASLSLVPDERRHHAPSSAGWSQRSYPVVRRRSPGLDDDADAEVEKPTKRIRKWFAGAWRHFVSFCSTTASAPVRPSPVGELWKTELTLRFHFSPFCLFGLHYLHCPSSFPPCSLRWPCVAAPLRRMLRPYCSW